jgi:hypothetical protein
MVVKADEIGMACIMNGEITGGKAKRKNTTRKVKM